MGQGEGEMRICANFICISLFPYVPIFLHPFTLSPLSFLCLSASHVLGTHHPAGEEPLSFRLLQISSFANHSWESTQGSGWLGEVQTHRWDRALGTISYMLPWSQGNFTKEELEGIHAILQLYFHLFPGQVQARASQFQLECEFALPSWFLPEGSAKVKMVYGLRPLFNLPDLVFCLRHSLSPLCFTLPVISALPPPQHQHRRTYMHISPHSPECTLTFWLLLMFFPHPWPQIQLFPARVCSPFFLA